MSFIQHLFSTQVICFFFMGKTSSEFFYVTLILSSSHAKDKTYFPVVKVVTCLCLLPRQGARSSES